MFGTNIDEGNTTICDDILINSPSHNVKIVQIWKDIIYHKALDANNVEKNFHNGESEKGSGKKFEWKKSSNELKNQSSL